MEKKTKINMTIPLILSYKNETLRIGDYFDIMVGIVSGSDKIYKNKIGNVKVITSFSDDKIITEKYILINKFPSKDKKINEHLIEHKLQLMNRKIRKFNKKNWFEWGALRNYKKIKKLKGNDCIYVKNLTRNETIATQHTISLFGGNLLIMIPKTKKILSLKNIVGFINSKIFRKRHTFSGRFKIGQRELTEILIPKEEHHIFYPFI